jgi:hypothetical protein
MAGKAFEGWIRDEAGYVRLTPVARCATDVTVDGEIAISLGEAAHSNEHCGQYLCSTNEAMTIAGMLVRAVALADAHVSARQIASRNDAAE